VGNIPVENTESAAPNLGGELLSLVPKSQNSGVSSQKGLLTPKQTLEPANMQSESRDASSDHAIATAVDNSSSDQPITVVTGNDQETESA